MARDYTPLPPLEALKPLIRLSETYPSGLEWAKDYRHHKQGEQCGRLHSSGKCYQIRVLGEHLYANRVIYYLRTGKDPGTADVIYSADNTEKDNRLGLELFQRPEPKKRKPSANYIRSLWPQY